MRERTGAVVGRDSTDGEVRVTYARHDPPVETEYSRETLGAVAVPESVEDDLQVAAPLTAVGLKPDGV